jgi:hypothetical protein
MNNASVDLGSVLSAGFEFFKRNFWILVLVNLVAAVISMLTIGILAGPMMAGVVMVTLALLDGRDPKPTVGDVFKGFEVFLPAFLYMIVLIAITALANLVIPGLSMIVSYVLSALTVFSIFFIAEDRMDFWPAIVRSYNIVKDNFFIFFLIVLVAGLISSAGLLACCIGIVFTAPYYYCVLAIVYRKHFPAASVATVDTVEVKISDEVIDVSEPEADSDEDAEKPAE